LSLSKKDLHPLWQGGLRLKINARLAKDILKKINREVGYSDSGLFQMQTNYKIQIVMKKLIKYSVYSLLFTMALNFTSCQEEFEKLPEPDEQETIMASSSTAKLIRNTSSYDGSFDNIVDGASCVAIRFPYVVNVNGLDINIDTREDLQLIEEIFDEMQVPNFEAGAELLEILFPITITTADYTEIVIDSWDDLRALAKECREGGDDDDIECIDFVYPVTFYTFDLNEQQSGSVVVDSDMDMRLFFKDLGENDLISIDFPVNLKLANGNEIQVNNNAELANAIENAKIECDEDDDNDYNDDDFTQERLEEYLVECPWLVNEVERDGLSQTDQYFEYLMDFRESGEVLVKDRLGNSLTGSWSTRVAGHKVLLKLEFDVLVDFNLEWYVYEIGEGKIKFFSEGGNRIILHRACDLFNADPESLRDILRECSWVIKKVKNQGEEIRRLIGYEFNFMAEGVVTLSNGITVYEGNWEIAPNAQGRLVMAITFAPNADTDPIVFEWPLAELKNDRLKFEIEDIDYELILQRVCNDNADDGDVGEIRNVMMAGEWVVARFAEGDMNDTAQAYATYTFDFGAEHLLSITNGDTGPAQAGLWRVLRNSDGKLKIYINAGEESPLSELTDDWHFHSKTDGRLEVRNESADGTLVILVFERVQP
jgi:hypothetical protein